MNTQLTLLIVQSAPLAAEIWGGSFFVFCSTCGWSCLLTPPRCDWVKGQSFPNTGEAVGVARSSGGVSDYQPCLFRAPWHKWGLLRWALRGAVRGDGCNPEGSSLPRPELCARALQPETSVFCREAEMCLQFIGSFFLIKFGFLLLIDLDRLANKQTWVISSCLQLCWRGMALNFWKNRM